jgi:hypothetical protein
MCVATKSAKRLSFDLANALTSEIQFATDFF